jgi:membrane protein
VALIGLAGLVGLSPSQLRSVIHGARVILPTQMSNLLDQALRNPLGQQASVEALVIGTAVALWSSVEAMAALQVGLDMARDAGVNRGLLGRRLNAIPMLAAVVVFGVPASVLLVLGNPIRSLLPASVPLARHGSDLAWGLLHWVGALILVVLLVSTLFVLSGTRKQRRWEWISPGSLVATAGWLVASVGFAFYLDHFGRESVTYGAFAGVAVLLLWLFLSSNAWQPIELWPESHRELWMDRADSRGRVHLNESPEQLHVIVCGGPVALHGVFLPSWGESLMQTRRVLHA